MKNLWGWRKSPPRARINIHLNERAHEAIKTALATAIPASLRAKALDSKKATARENRFIIVGRKSLENICVWHRVRAGRGVGWKMVAHTHRLARTAFHWTRIRRWTGEEKKLPFSRFLAYTSKRYQNAIDETSRIAFLQITSKSTDRQKENKHFNHSSNYRRYFIAQKDRKDLCEARKNLVEVASSLKEPFFCSTKKNGVTFFLFFLKMSLGVLDWSCFSHLDS